MDWIRRGLRFECQPDCGKCCSNAAREGSVFLEPADIETLATHVGLSTHRFVQELTSNESGEIELAKRDNGDCVFLEDKRCTVQEAKPLQCRVYPFFPLDGYTPIESRYTWRYEARFCPGIGKGRFYPKREIADIVRGRADVRGFSV